MAFFSTTSFTRILQLDVLAVKSSYIILMYKCATQQVMP